MLQLVMPVHSSGFLSLLVLRQGFMLFLFHTDCIWAICQWVLQPWQSEPSSQFLIFPKLMLFSVSWHIQECPDFLLNLQSPPTIHTVYRGFVNVSLGREMDLHTGHPCHTNSFSYFTTQVFFFSSPLLPSFPFPSSFSF